MDNETRRLMAEVDAELTANAAAKVIEEEVVRLRTGLAGLLQDARGADGPAKVAASKRLKVFGSVSDPVLATKLALMNRSERRAFMARRKGAAGKARAVKLGGAGKKKERKR